LVAEVTGRPERIPMVLEPDEAARASAVDEPVRRRQISLAVMSSVIGTSIEWYDFFLYGTC
jgi:hypothetical protein